VPMIVSFPGRIPSGEAIKVPVSHLDVHSTILDYLGASQQDQSDGKSLRRYIDKTHYNALYDDEIAVSFIDNRRVENNAIVGPLSDQPNFMIR